MGSASVELVVSVGLAVSGLNWLVLVYVEPASVSLLVLVHVGPPIEPTIKPASGSLLVLVSWAC